MNWVFAISIALLCFVLGAFLFRLPRAAWTLLGAALVFGLTGYAIQQRGDIPSAPAPARTSALGEAGWRLIDLRREIVSDRYHSRSREIVTADAMFRQGQFDNAVALLRGAVEANPNDYEAWLAMGNALVEHTGGVMTPAAVFAYTRAEEVAPSEPGPAFFFGLDLVRQGKLIEAHQVWSGILRSAPEDAKWRPVVADRVAALEQLMRQIVEQGRAREQAEGRQPAGE